MKNILLKGKIPVRLIQEPYCKRCMNHVEGGEEYCGFCIEGPPTGGEWLFNKSVSLCNYKTYPNIPYNNIPKNILSRMILSLKGSVKKHKKDIGDFLADGLFQIAKRYPFLIEDLSYIIIPPKNNKEEENQCKHILNPLIKKLNNEGIKVKDLSGKIKRNKDIGKIRDKNSTELKYKTMMGVHELNEKDLHNAKVLILDDIITSRSTIQDISRALKERNCGEINVLSVGRTFLESGDIETFSTDLNYFELLTYFSKCDLQLEPSKIEDVEIIEHKFDDNVIETKCGTYDIRIDFNKKEIKHKCVDFERTRLMNKSFCKHITKVFIHIKELNGEEKATELLNSIFSNILDWKFTT